MYDGIPIILIEKYCFEKDTVIIVTPTYAFEDIVLNLKSKCLVAEANILSIDSILG